MRKNNCRLETVRIVLLTISILMVCSGTVTSQIKSDSRGMDFWVAFPPTEHTLTSNGQLAVFVSTDSATNVTVIARDRDGVETTTNRTLAAGTIGQFEFDVADFELRGTDFRLFGNVTRDCEKAMPASVHVLTDQDVAVYALVRDSKTSDAWLVLPTDALGLDHRILTYPSDRTAFGDTRYPSQFVLIATEDDTEVDISLQPGRSSVRDGASRSIVLDRGESYLLQAEVTITGPTDDMSGSLVRSTKPIAVLSSHYRAQVPDLGSQASRDILVEQVSSVDTWGKRFVVPPLQRPADFDQQGQNDVVVVRILAHSDDTEVSVNGWPNFPVPKGTIWELPLTDEGRSIESTEPVLVAIVDRSANRRGSDRTGDPSLIIVPPVEQYLSEYLVLLNEPRSVTNPLFTEHFLTLTAPMDYVGAILVDGAPIPPLTEVGATGYGYATLPYTESGIHDIQADTGVGIIAYGYGPAESYGYTGGMAFEKLYQPTVRLRVLDTMAAPGENVSLVVVVDSLAEGESFNALGIRRLEYELSYDRSVFVPTEPQGSTLDIRGSIRVEHAFDTLGLGDTVGVVEGTAVLGMIEYDTVVASDPHWITETGDSLDIETYTEDGSLWISELCREGGRLRLFDPTAGSMQPVEIRVYDLMGRERTEVGPGWNVIVRLQGRSVQVERQYVPR